MLSPLFELDEEANLYMTEKMARRLRVAGLEHIGKNIKHTTRLDQTHIAGGRPLGPRGMLETPAQKSLEQF